MASNRLWAVVILFAALLGSTLAGPLASRQTYLANRLDNIFPASHSQAMRRLMTLTEVWTDEDATLSLNGKETQANTYTHEEQMYPDIAALEDGGYVIVWSSWGQDLSELGVFAQMFNADGTKNGQEFQVNTYTTDNQHEPAVASLVSGGFVISWSSIGGDASGYGVYAQIYDASGDPVATEIAVNTYMSGNQEYSDLTGLLDGGFLIAWTSVGSSSGASVFAQRFDAIGTRMGDEFQVNPYSLKYYQSRPSVSRLDSGDVIITWQTTDGWLSSGIAARMFDETATAIEEEFMVNTYTNGSQTDPKVAPLSGGGYIITWFGYGQNSETYEIYAQRFDSSSNRVGSEFQVNEYFSGSSPGYPTVTGLVGGYFVITYEVGGDQDGDEQGVFAQVFDKQGTKIGDEFTVNDYKAYDQRKPHIATLQDGTFVITWASDEQDTSDHGIFFQMYDFSADSDPPTKEPTTNPTKSPTKSPSNPTCVDVWSMIQTYTAQCSLSCSEISSISAAQAALLPNEDGVSPQDDTVIVSPGGEGGDADDLLKTTRWSSWYDWSNYKDEILLLSVVMNVALMLSLCNMRRQSTEKYEPVHMYSSEAANLNE